jgi:GAF domain-containing protein
MKAGALGALLPAGLARRFARAFVGLVTAALLVNGAISMWLSYEEATTSAIGVQREKALAAAERVAQFVGEIEGQIGWTTRAEWSRVPAEQRRYDFIRLLRQAPAVTEALHIDGQGREQLRLSRLEPDVVGSGVDLSADPRFARAVADRVWYGPVYFRRGSEPYMTLSIAHAGRNPGVTSVGVNLKLVWDVITGIRVGEQGYAYVTDAAGKLIAHPDMSLVLRDTDLSNLPQVAAAVRSAREEKSIASPETVRSPDGRDVLTASARIPKLGWLVFVELPRREALAPVLTSLYQTLALLGLGTTIALLLGGWQARRMAAPIRLLEAGAQKLGEGDLAQRVPVTSRDEIGRLAERFNAMAGRIQEARDTLEQKVEDRTRELAEALQQQTATAEVLKVISRSAFDLQHVLETLAQSAAQLCDAETSWIFRTEGEHLRWAASYGFSGAQYEAIKAYFQEQLIKPGRGSLVGRTALAAKPVMIEDVFADPEYKWTRAQELGGYRTTFGTPLLRNGVVVGVLCLTRNEVRAFTPRQIEFAMTFADQAVIAIENARLIEEVQARTRDLEESLEQQTATADVLKVISRSVFDLQPVLRTLIDTAVRLCRGSRGTIYLRDGDILRAAAFHSNVPPELKEHLEASPIRIKDSRAIGRAVREGRIVHVEDFRNDPSTSMSQAPQFARFGSMLYVPLIRDGEPIGCFAMPREEVKPFNQREIELVQTFADQAVIAIENARLFEQVQARTAELQESLEYQTATSEVLGVISRSPSEIQPVLDSIVETAARICDAWIADVMLVKDGAIQVRATFGEMGRPLGEAVPIDRESVMGRSIVDKCPVQVADLLHSQEFPRGQDFARRFGHRTTLAVPLMQGEQVLGTILLRRSVVEPFSDKQVALLRTFADQAVIAINNVGLFEQVQARTAELQESLEYQTAITEVLGVISRSPSAVQPIFDTIVATAARLCHADQAFFMRFNDGMARAVASSNDQSDLARYMQDNPVPLHPSTMTGRVVAEGRTVHIPDCLAEADYGATAHQKVAGYRTMLGVPLLREGTAIGSISLLRIEVEPFTDKQIALVETFADQAMIAIENARLFEQVQTRTRELQQSLDDLRAAQDRLVQTEKLASLGQLTAGIAHEIKNPLNFVNNFSELSIELVEELEEALAKAEAALDPAIRDETAEIAGMLKSNLAKVASHGKRADSIVKNMLAHSREGGGERRAVDLNALVDEALNLAYHGARAEKPGFNIALERDYDAAAGQVELYPQEFTRVLLNLIGNGFHAAHKRAQEQGQEKSAANGFQPTLKVSTRATPKAVEIRVRDNGTGMPEHVKARIFEPFFTTKPTGEGTGLGLSLSHDIVVKQHGGAIAVETAPNAFTEFTVTLPRGAAKGRAAA